MRLTQRQLRSLVEQALTEAKVDSDDAAKQVQDAVKVLIKFAPMLAGELSEAAQEANDHGVVGDMADRLFDVSFTLENLPIELEKFLDLVNTFKTVKKVVKQAGREQMKAAKAVDKKGSARRTKKLPKAHTERPLQPYRGIGL